MRFVSLFLDSNTDLIFELAKRDFQERYLRNSFGIFWLLFKPLFLSICYIFIFSKVFSMKLSIDAEPYSYGLFFLSGFCVWLYTSEALLGSCFVLRKHAPLIKHVKFSYSTVVVASLLPLVVFQSLFLIVVLAIKGMTVGLNPFVFFVVPAILIQFTLLTSLALFISPIALRWRDTNEIIALLLAVGLFLTPVLFPPGAVPATISRVIELNPLSHIIFMFQDVLFFGSFTNSKSWIYCITLTIPALLFSIRFFRKFQLRFQDWF